MITKLELDWEKLDKNILSNFKVVENNGADSIWLFEIDKTVKIDSIIGDCDSSVDEKLSEEHLIDLANSILNKLANTNEYIKVVLIKDLVCLESETIEHRTDTFTRYQYMISFKFGTYKE